MSQLISDIAKANVKRRKLDWYGFVGFRGAKGPMQAYAAELDAPIQLQVTLPCGKLAPEGVVEQFTFIRHFVAVESPARLIEILSGLPNDANHVYEIIMADKPCKLCMDFDGKDGLPACFASQQDFTSRVQTALTNIFATEFGVQMQAESFVWVFTDYPAKFSAHLIIHHVMPDGKILCMPHHHPAQATHNGAKHLYNLVIKAMPELLEHKLIDGSIYTRDREMRLPGATKPPKPGVHMATWTPNTAYIATNHSLIEAMISYHGGRTPHVLQLPTAERPKRAKNSGDPQAPLQGLSCSEGEQRMLELIMQQHPTVYMVRLSGRNVWNRDQAPRFNHTDRGEPCWCGKPHTTNNYAAWFVGSLAFVHAFGCKRDFRIGSLRDDFSAAGDREVHCRYLARRPLDNMAAAAAAALTGGQQNMHRYMEPTDAPQDTECDITSLNSELNKLMDMRTRVLCIQSSMGTGKTCMLSTLVQELADVHQAKRVLAIVYRQALSLNMLSDLQALGFENYMDAKEQKKDISTADRVIVQLESIGMVCRQGRIIPGYDLVVLDEIESTLHHTTSKTHKDRQATNFRTFCAIIKASKRVLAMDAFLGAETRAFFKSLQLKTCVVRNTWRPQPRTMVFTNVLQKWVAELMQCLEAGQNVAVASMSACMLHRVKKHVVEVLALLTEEEVLLYDSAADDELKKRVQFVNSDWINKRLVMWSPCIEAGVNFDRKHFHSIFLYLCQTTTPLGLMQMSGRVRQLENSTVHCMCEKLMWQGATDVFTPADAVNHIRWHETLIWPEGFKAELPCDEEILETGEMAILRSADHPAMVVASHNYARIINGRSRFLLEIINLIEHAGHRWKKGTWRVIKRKQEPEQLPYHTKQSVLLKARVVDSSEADVLTALQLSNQLNRGQKEALERYFFCKAWGIRNKALDGDFFKRHPTADGDAATVRVLQAALSCKRTFDTTTESLADDGGEMMLPVQARAKVIAELLMALGIKNVLDTAQDGVTLTPAKLGALRACQAFKSAELSCNTARVFGIDSSASCHFKKVGSVTKRLAALFEAGAGLELVSMNQRCQRAGTRARIYTVSFESSSVSGMAQLLKLKYSRLHRSTWASKQVADYLDKLQLSKPYIRYIEQTACSAGELELSSEELPDDF